MGKKNRGGNGGGGKGGGGGGGDGMGKFGGIDKRQHQGEGGTRVVQIEGTSEAGGGGKVKLSMKQKRMIKEERRSEKKQAAKIEQRIEAKKAPMAASAPMAVKANPLSRTSSTTRAHLTSAAFASLKLSAATQRAIHEVLGYETMTAVQEQTLPVALAGKDVIAKAKTGTGKTIGFLLPTIERLLAARAGGGARRGVLALAISPTRELASQIREEAEQLISFHKPALSTLVVVGGTNVTADARKLATNPPSLLVGTPGRLNDLLANHGAAALLSGLVTLIFDEADQLLEMGFRPDVLKVCA